MNKAFTAPELLRLMRRAFELLGTRLSEPGGADNLGRFAAQYLEELRRLPEWGDAVNAIELDPLFAPTLNKYFEHHAMWVHLTPSRLIQSLLFPQIHARGFIFDENFFDHLYNKLITFLSATHVRFRVLGLLSGNLQCYADAISLRNNLSLRKFSPEERSTLRNQLGPLVPSSWRLDESQPAYVLETQFARQKVLLDAAPSPTPERVEITVEQIKRVVSAMRLAREGDVYLPIVVIENEDWIPEGTPLFYVEDLYVRGAARRYEIGVAEGYEWIIDNMVSSLESAPGYLSLPLRRFNLSFHRETAEDRLIDYMICLEAVYAKDSRTEIGYRIALRGALAIARWDERQKTFRQLRKAYDVRSDIVHGAEVRKIKVAEEEIPLEMLVEMTEEDVRRSLRYFLSHPQRESQQSILDALDGEALR